MKIEKVKISELNPAEYNPRRMTNKQYEDLKNSLEKFGLVDPIIINADNTVVGGHQRLRIMRELGAELVPIVRVNLSKKDEKELNIRLNKNTGEFDLDVLANNFEVDELKEWGFKDVEFGFNIDKIVEGNIEDDYIPQVKESKVKLGDVWQLGKHRLMCADSTNIKNVESLVKDKEIDCLFIDPPYQMENKEQLVAIKNACKKIKNGNILLMTAISSLMELYKYLSTNLKFRYDVIWKRTTPHLGANLTKPLIFHTNIHIYGKNKFFFNRKNSIEDIDRIRSVINAKKDLTAGRGNKPIDLMIQLLDAFSRKLVLDIFGGNGSTIIACEKKNRNCYCIEIDPKYCDVIIERWEQFTGQKAKKI